MPTDSPTTGATAQEAYLNAVAGGAEVNNESRALFHKLGLWGIANSISQNHGLSAAVVQKQFGAGGVGGVDPAQIQKLMDTVPFGGSVNITNIGTQPSEAPSPTNARPSPTAPVAAEPLVNNVRPPTAPAPATPAAPAQSNLGNYVATGLIAALAGAAGVGIPAYMMSGGTAPPVKQPGINGELELEIPFNIERTKTKSTNSSSSSSGS